jgi:hypothetical protein
MIILEEGDKIHLKNKNGMYTIVNVNKNSVDISCKKWIARADHPNFIPTQNVPYSEINCLAGGGHNRRRFETYDIKSLSMTKQLN